MIHQGSMECKLLSSVFYDLGKGLATSCPHPPDLKEDRTNEYFLRAVDEFLLSFPTLATFVQKSDLRIQNGTNSLSCFAFLKMNSRNGFMMGTRKIRDS